MKKQLRMAAVIGGAILLLTVVVVSILSNSPPSDGNSTYPTVADADLLYNNAADIVKTAQNISLEISQTKEIIADSENFKEQSLQSVRYEALGTDRMRGAVEETISIGSHDIKISEIYADSTGYFTVAGSSFRGSISPEAYQKRYAPAVPLSAELYGSITGVDAGDTTIITFTQSTDIEPWIAEAGAQSICADGTAYINKSGQLTKSVYSVQYALEGTNIRYTVTVEIDYADPAPIQIPENAASYTQIAYLDGPRMLEKACGYLLEATSITANYSDRISCEAFGDERTQTITLNMTDTADWSAQMDTELTLMNSSKAGVVSTLLQTEYFIDNTYTITVNGGEPTPNTDIDAAAMREYCQDLLVGTIMLPKYITDANITETEHAYHIAFSASEEFAQILRAEACTTLYQSSDILTQQSQSYTTDTISCYLTLDKTTGLPTASGFQYLGTYTLDALPYRLQYQADQHYAPLGDTADRTISEAAGAA